MTIYDLVRKSRSYRRFKSGIPVARKTLEELVELARLSPSLANKQPLKFILSSEPARNALIFPCLRWAGYLKDWPGPAEKEKPAAYIIVLGDKEISGSIECDHGIACQSMLLGAAERGLGGCIIGSIDRPRLRAALDIPERYEILLAVALGVPDETVILERMEPGGRIEYWRDGEGRHHVPKRSLEELILG